MSELQTQIESVTVYPDRALVTRRGAVAVESGASEILVVGLPPSLDVDSLRANGRGNVAVKIVAVEARERKNPRSSSEKIREVQDELERVQDEIKALYEREGELEARGETVKTLAEKSAKSYARQLSTGATSFEKVRELLDFLDAQRAQIGEAARELTSQKRDLAQRQNELQSRLKSLQGERGQKERVVAVKIEANGAGNFELELSYGVSGASWQPLYDARATLGENPRLALHYGALVRQKSGESWENVALTLSTARPSLGTLPPKLEPVWIDVPRPVAYAAAPMMRAKIASGDEFGAMLEGLKPVQKLEDPRGGSAPEPIIEAIDEVASESSEGATITFSLPTRASVPSDGEPHRVTIANDDLPARFDYLAIPRRVDVAYLRAKIERAPQTLLEGQANIFRDGVFVGQSLVKHTAQNQDFSLFLGPDDGVRAKRELLSREAEKNLLGNVARTHFSYAITLENGKAAPVQLTVQDQIPVSRSESIKIKLRGCEPNAVPTPLGVLEWKLNLAPRETKTLRFDFLVEAPRDTPILGLKD